VAAYTAQLGNGRVASLSFEEPPSGRVQHQRRHVAATPALPVGGLPLQDMNHVRYPTLWPTFALTRPGQCADHGRIARCRGWLYGTTVGGGACTGAVGTQ